MILTVCAVRDTVADVYHRPYFMQSAGVAVRSFTDEVMREGEDNQLYKHPQDFVLYELGTYDDADAKFTLHDAPKHLIKADQCLPTKH